MSGTAWETCPEDIEPRTVVKILRAAEAARLVGEGLFGGSVDDRADGFVHLSTPPQVKGTIGKHFAGESPLFLAICDAAALGGELRWEPSRGGDLFPHLYRSLTLADVVLLVPVPEDVGRLQIPSVKEFS